MTKLSDTARIVLVTAAQHEMGIARPPMKLPMAACNAVFRSLIKKNLLIESKAPHGRLAFGWRQDENGAWIVAHITDEGLRAIGIDPNEGAAEADTAPTVAEDEAPATQDAAPAEAPTARHSLRDAATALLAAWDACPAQDAADNAISRAVEQMRASLAQPAPRKQREGTKQEQVLDMLRRPEGATVEQVSEATGWAQHTVRGFFAGLKKKGHAVEARERIRMVGPNKTGAKGSYTIYALAK
jgi:hypothetical protein